MSSAAPTPVDVPSTIARACRALQCRTASIISFAAAGRTMLRARARIGSVNQMTSKITTATQPAGKQRIVRNDHIERDQVEDPRQMSQRAGDCGRAEAVPSIEPTTQGACRGGRRCLHARPYAPGENAYGEQQQDHAADDIGDSLRPVAAGVDVDAMEHPHHDDAEGDAEPESRHDVGPQQASGPVVKAVCRPQRDSWDELCSPAPAR